MESRLKILEIVRWHEVGSMWSDFGLFCFNMVWYGQWLKMFGSTVKGCGSVV
jgi:hypothetical protein